MWIRIKTQFELEQQGIPLDSISWVSPQMDCFFGQIFEYREPLSYLPWSISGYSPGIHVCIYDREGISWFIGAAGFQTYEYNPVSINVGSGILPFVSSNSDLEVIKNSIKDSIKDTIREVLSENSREKEDYVEKDGTNPYAEHISPDKAYYAPEWENPLSSNRTKKEHELQKLKEGPISLHVVDNHLVPIKKLPSGRKEKPIILTNIE